MLRHVTAAVAIVVFSAGVAQAGAFSIPAPDQASAPVLALPSSAGTPAPSLASRLFDTSRFHLSHTVVMSSGFGAGTGGTRSMAYSTLSYDVGGPLTAAVTVGNRLFGSPRYPGDTGKMSLESLRLNYQPSSNLSIHVDMVGRNYLRDTAIGGVQEDWTRR